MTQSARATFWVRRTDLAKLSRARHICYLVGGYTGQGNYGDILQLATNLARLRPLEHDILPVPLFEARSRDIHQTICSDYPGIFGDTCFLYYRLGPKPTASDTPATAYDDLVELTDPPPGFSQLLVYGGGNFTEGWGWGAHTLEEIEALQDWMRRDGCVSEVPHLLIIGQQVSSGFLAAPEGERFKQLLGTAFAIGVRDRVSFDAIARTCGQDISSKLFLSGDDAVPHIVENILNDPTALDENDEVTTFHEEKLVVNVQMSLEYYVTDEPIDVLDTVTFCIRELRHLHRGAISVNLVSGYEDRRISETVHLEKLEARLDAYEIDYNRVIGLSDLRRGFSNIGRADLTICCSYHTALTSLVLGIPTLLLHTNPYYTHKHTGLSLDFGIPSSMIFDPANGDREDLARTLERIVSSPDLRRRLSVRAIRGTSAMAARNAGAAVVLFEFLAAGRLAELHETYRVAREAPIERTGGGGRFGLGRVRAPTGSLAASLPARSEQESAPARRIRAAVARGGAVRDLATWLDRVRGSLPPQLYRGLRRLTGLFTPRRCSRGFRQDCSPTDDGRGAALRRR